MKPKEIREKSAVEREKLVGELLEEMFRLRLKKSTGQLEKNHRIGSIRRDLARLYTIQRESKV